MKNLTATLCLIAFTCMVIGCSPGDRTVQLSLKHQAGEQLQYQQTTSRTTKVFEADSLVKESSHTYVVDIYEEIIAIDNDKIAEIVERNVWHYQQPNKDDSTVMDSVTHDREMTLWVKPNGKIVDIKFAQDENPTSMVYIRNYLEQGMPEYPSAPVSPGKEWTQTKTLMLPGESMEASTHYRVKSLAREAGYDCAVIEFEGNLIIPIEPNPEKDIVRSGVDRVTTTGIIYFAYKEGMVVLQRERWVIDGERATVTDGKTVNTSIVAEIDADFILMKRALRASNDN